MRSYLIAKRSVSCINNDTGTRVFVQWWAEDKRVVYNHLRPPHHVITLVKHRLERCYCDTKQRLSLFISITFTRPKCMKFIDGVFSFIKYSRYMTNYM